MDLLQILSNRTFYNFMILLQNRTMKQTNYFLCNYLLRQIMNHASYKVSLLFHLKNVISLVKLIFLAIGIQRSGNVNG